MLPTHCTELGFDVLSTVFTVGYTAPFHANVVHDLTWSVSGFKTHRSSARLVTWSGHVAAQAEGAMCIEATGEVLVAPRS
jgi:hypothetical protein